MKLLAAFMVFVVAALHGGFLVLEMFLWQHPLGMSVFSLNPAEAAQTATLAANQGLYNGFLAAGLLWGLLRGSREFILFFLLCVMVAGIYGAMTVNVSVFFIQATPALIALILNLLYGKPKATEPAP